LPSGRGTADFRPMGNTRLFLVRHGAVASAWKGRIYGCLDVPLSEAGEAEARAAALELADEPIDLVVSSGLARAEYGGARIRAARGLERHDDPELREIDRGDWVGQTFEELEREHPGAWEAWSRAPDRERPPAGESLADVAARVVPRLDHWVEVCDGGVLAVVAHRWVIRAAVCHARDLALSRATEIDVPTGGLIAVDW